MVIAWLLEHNHADAAHKLLDAIATFLDRLRFYPVIFERPEGTGFRWAVLLVDCRKRKANKLGSGFDHIHAASSAKPFWPRRPMYDRLVGLFLETGEGGAAYSFEESRKEMALIIGGWPCQSFSSDWKDRAKSWL